MPFWCWTGNNSQDLIDYKTLVTKCTCCMRRHAHTTACHTLVNVAGPSVRIHFEQILIFIHCGASEPGRVDFYWTDCCQTESRGNALCRSRHFTFRMTAVQQYVLCFLLQRCIQLNLPHLLLCKSFKLHKCSKKLIERMCSDVRCNVCSAMLDVWLKG